jgi:hypothetical protein
MGKSKYIDDLFDQKDFSVKKLKRNIRDQKSYANQKSEVKKLSSERTESIVQSPYEGLEAHINAPIALVDEDDSDDDDIADDVTLYCEDHNDDDTNYCNYDDANYCKDDDADCLDDDADYCDDDDALDSNDEIIKDNAIKMLTSTVSVEQFNQMLLYLMFKHNLNYSAVNSIIELSSKLLPEDSRRPKRIQNIIKFYNKQHKQFIKKYYICYDCEKISETGKCHADSAEFVALDMIKQIEIILSNDEYLKQIESACKIKHSNKIESPLDGSVYKEFLLKNKIKYDLLISLNFNADGAPVTNSRGYSMWPILATITELEKSCREKFSNLIFLGFWLNLKKPIYQKYLEMVLDQYLNCIQGKLICIRSI